MPILVYITGMNGEKTFGRKIRPSFLQQIKSFIHLYLYSKRIVSAWTLLISHYGFKWKHHPLWFLFWGAVSIFCCWGISMTRCGPRKTFSFSFCRCYCLGFRALGRTLNTLLMIECFMRYIFVLGTFQIQVLLLSCMIFLGLFSISTIKIDSITERR